MLSCCVTALDGSETAARSAYAVLRAQERLGLEVALQSPGPDTHCDVVVFVVQRETLQRATAEIARLRSVSPACSIIVICEDLLAAQITALLGAGAFDFLASPYHANELCTRAQRAAGLLSYPKLDDSAAVRIARSHDLIGASAGFVKQLACLPVISGCDASVLILGETGTGKEVFARTIHYLSARASRPLVAVNCGAIPTELVETELFGCVRGAYTSAHAARNGLVREAEGGTLFLDEVDSLPVGAQTKLLRFLQEKEYRPVGGSLCRADVRVVAAGSQGLPELVERGGFRRDLYFRLNVLNLCLPPLRERREDIAELARHFTDQCCRQRRRAPVNISAPALRKLLRYDWPGNIRELHNVIERAVLFCPQALLRPDDLQLPDTAPVEDELDSFRAAKARTVEVFERSYIERVLSENGGNITRAAQAAQKNRRAFFALMRKHAITPERFRNTGA
jgi:two-component system, NtrC family, response regulator GlrR